MQLPGGDCQHYGSAVQTFVAVDMEQREAKFVQVAKLTLVQGFQEHRYHP